MAYLRIIRPSNLLLIAFVQCIIKFGLFDPLNVETALSSFQFLLLILATLCIAAAGNVINDLYDVDIDIINKPERVLVGKKISEKAAYNYYFALTVVGVAFGFILANQIGKPGLAAIFIVISALLYVYSSQLKAMLLVGNLLVSALVAMSLLVVIIFDIFPAINMALMYDQIHVSRIVLHYAVFAFVINFIRELVKDLEDINGDKNGGMSTLAIALGRKRTMMIVFSLVVITLFGIIAYMYAFLYDSRLMVLYFLLLIIAPLIYFCVKGWGAESKKEFSRLSLVLKLVMFTGVCSMLLNQFTNII